MRVCKHPENKDKECMPWLCPIWQRRAYKTEYAQCSQVELMLRSEYEESIRSDSGRKA